MFRSHATLASKGRSEHPHRGPAAVLLMVAGTHLADAAKNLSADLASTDVLPIEPQRIVRLNFDQTFAAIVSPDVV